LKNVFMLPTVARLVFLAAHDASRTSPSRVAVSLCPRTTLYLAFDVVMWTTALRMPFEIVRFGWGAVQGSV